jgi:hypothetical protein
MADIEKSGEPHDKPASWGSVSLITAIAVILLGVITLGLAQSLNG